MKGRHRKTLLAVYSDPVSGTIAWADLEALLVAAGCEVIEGSGSRVRFVRMNRTAVSHRPHPAKEAKRYQVRDARRLLSEIGVFP